MSVEIDFCTKRGAGATTTLVGTPVLSATLADAAAATWTFSLTASGLGGLNLVFLGQTNKTIVAAARVIALDIVQ